MGNWFSSPDPKPKALTDKAWRDILHKEDHWSEKAHDEYKTSIVSSFCVKENIKKANILLLGPISSGKSSFVNSVLSVSKGRILQSAYSGQSEKSFTTKYSQYRDNNFFKNFILHDCMGLEDGDGQGFNVDDVIYMIQGNIPKDYKFNPRAPISVNDPNYDSNPPSEARVHCVIFFIDATTINFLPRDLFRKIGELQSKIKDMEVPRLLCITKIDKLCKEVNSNLKHTFYSKQVRDTVKLASELFNIQEGCIHPIKNYEKEVNTNILVDMLLMIPLRQALDNASDYLERHG